MTKKEQNIVTSKKKKLRPITHPPELLTKSGSMPALPLNAEPESKEAYPKPIFKSRRFDLF